MPISCCFCLLKVIWRSKSNMKWHESIETIDESALYICRVCSKFYHAGTFNIWKIELLTEFPAIGRASTYHISSCLVNSVFDNHNINNGKWIIAKSLCDWLGKISDGHWIEVCLLHCFGWNMNPPYTVFSSQWGLSFSSGAKRAEQV